MIPSAAEIESVVTRAVPGSSTRDTESLRRMLAGLRDTEPGRRREALGELCAIGVDYGWRELKRSIPPDLLEWFAPRAQRNLRRYLRESLEWITRPCFELEWTSFTVAMTALRLGSSAREKFLGKQPSQRLFVLFTRFPVLAALWSVAIDQWRRHVAEILARSAADEEAIARALFGEPAGQRIKDVRLGLSDRHVGGRSVALVEFECGRVIYKPRSGTSEVAWASVLRWMNENGFQPQVKEAQILRRKGYHWMEYIEPVPCERTAAVRRFYERTGGIIAAAYLLNAVDCHRENLIASGEHPVLVDIDALWHVSSFTRNQSPAELLDRTGFFPNADPDSLQSRSSVLGKATTGTHQPRLGTHRELAADYADHIVAGFSKGWRSLVGTPRRRTAFVQRVNRIRARERRWIYRSTESYAAIIGASLQPSALTSAAARHALVRRLAARNSPSPAILKVETRSLEQLDIPYFVRRTNQSMGSVTATPPPELRRALVRALGIWKQSEERT